MDRDHPDYKYSFAAWAEAFNIFAKYAPDQLHAVVAEHDQIWAGPDPRDVSAEDHLRLGDLGWFISSEGFSHFV
jgi:hypothetical protein